MSPTIQEQLARVSLTIKELDLLLTVCTYCPYISPDGKRGLEPREFNIKGLSAKRHLDEQGLPILQAYNEKRDRRVSEELEKLPENKEVESLIAESIELGGSELTDEQKEKLKGINERLKQLRQSMVQQVEEKLNGDEELNKLFSVDEHDLALSYNALGILISFMETHSFHAHQVHALSLKDKLEVAYNSLTCETR